MSTILETPLGRFRKISRDGEELDDHEEWLWECPGCGAWGRLDADQWNGRVSVDCAATLPGCKGKYHETHDYGAALKAARNTNEQA